MHREINAGAVYTNGAAQAKAKPFNGTMRAKDSLVRRLGNQHAGKGFRVESIGGYLWLIITVIMVAVLAAAILWGSHEWRQRRRGPQADRRSDEAVKRVYREKDSWS